jgi:hypothetical protein
VFLLIFYFDFSVLSLGFGDPCREAMILLPSGIDLYSFSLTLSVGIFAWR